MERHLRLVKAVPDPRQTAELTDDPLLADFFRRRVIDATPGRRGIFHTDDIVVLKLAMKGRMFSREDIVELDAWVREYDPYQGGVLSTRERLARLDEFVEDQLRKVGSPTWLSDPLKSFERMVEDKKKRGLTEVRPRLLRAVFVALLTVRATKAQTG